MFAFRNPCANAELHQQKRARKLCSTTLNSIILLCNLIYKYKWSIKLLLLYGWTVSTTAKLTHNTKGPSSLLCHNKCNRLWLIDSPACIIVLLECSHCSPHLHLSFYPWTWCLSHYCQLLSVLLSVHSDQEWIHLNMFRPSRHSRSFHDYISHIIPFVATLNSKNL